MPPTPVSWDGLNSHGQPLTWGDPEFIWDADLPTPTPNKNKKMPQLRILLSFTSGSDHLLEETAGAVLDGLYGNPAFTTPPVLQPALQTALTAFTDAIAAQTNGGPAATAMKNNMRQALIDLLRTLAAYVQQTSNNDLAVLLSSGFQAASTNHAQSPLPAPMITKIENGMSSQLLISVNAIANSHGTQMRYALAPAGQVQGPWQDGGTNTDSRKMPLDNLIPGSNYVIQACALGGSTGHSDWSMPVGHMCM